MQTVTLQVPEELYARIRERAERSRRTIEAELVDVLAAAVPDGDVLTPELHEAIAPLERLGDAELWNIARQRLPEKVSAELESLHMKQQRTGLTPAERERSEELYLDYDRVMFVRASAAALLSERMRGLRHQRERAGACSSQASGPPVGPPCGAEIRSPCMGSTCRMRSNLVHCRGGRVGMLCDDTNAPASDKKCQVSW